MSGVYSRSIGLMLMVQSYHTAIRQFSGLSTNADTEDCLDIFFGYLPMKIQRIACLYVPWPE